MDDLHLPPGYDHVAAAIRALPPPRLRERSSVLALDMAGRTTFSTISLRNTRLIPLLVVMPLGYGGASVNGDAGLGLKAPARPVEMRRSTNLTSRTSSR